MNVTLRMIDKQLRLVGVLMRFFMRNRSEKSMRRKDWSRLFFAGRKPNDLQYTEEWISRGDGSTVRVVVYKPLQANDNLPGVLWIHGGGYVLGTPEQDIAFYRKLIRASPCVIVSPDYRLAPERPYPAALDDCYTTLLWMKENNNVLGLRQDQLAVGGDSAGGGLTAALSLYARDRKEVNIAFQMPLYPMIDDRMTTESAKENNAPVWDSTTNQSAWKIYLGDLYGKNVTAYAAPARATDYSHLPPTITYVGDIETFRDETIQYVANLRKAGIPVDFALFKGCYHGFDILCPWAGVSQRASTFLSDRFTYAVQHYFAGQNN